MKLNKRIIVGSLIVILFPVIAYTIEYTFKSAGLKSGVIIKISRNNQVAAYFGSDVLKKLPAGSGNSHEGPALRSVLIAAGISHFGNANISGGKGDTSCKISSKEMSSNYRFYYTDHNTVNLVKKSGDLHQILVKDVSAINAMD